MELTTELILVAIPIILFQYGFAFWCILKILKEDVENLSKSIWMGICLLLGIVGCIAFLLVGRKKDVYDQN